jgi:hypothetical protein
MEFSINKNSTLPILKLELINDGRNDFYKFHEKIQNANIYFSMTDVITGVKRIAKKLTGIQQVEPASDCVGDEFYLIYQFTERDTAVGGRYVGQFEIDFLDGTGTLLVPIRETLMINILNQGIMK